MSSKTNDQMNYEKALEITLARALEQKKPVIENAEKTATDADEIAIHYPRHKHSYAIRHLIFERERLAANIRADGYHEKDANAAARADLVELIESIALLESDI